MVLHNGSASARVRRKHVRRIRIGGAVDYVVLDTCVLVNCTLVNSVGADPELLATLAEKMREKGVRLLLPAVIECEYGRKVPEELGLIREQTKRFRKAVTTQVLPASDVDSLHKSLDQLDAKREESVEVAQAYFREMVEDVTLTVRVPLSGEIIAEAVSYTLAGRKPSRGVGRGLLDPDSLIVASIAAYARAQTPSSGDRVLVCSDNHEDFGVWDPDAGKHMIAPEIAAAIACDVLFFKSPRDLVEELQVDVSTDEPLAQALDEYDGVAKTMASMSAIRSYESFIKNLNVYEEAVQNLSGSLSSNLAMQLKQFENPLKDLTTSYYANLMKGLTFQADVLERLSPSWNFPASDSDDDDSESDEPPDDDEGCGVPA